MKVEKIPNDLKKLFAKTRANVLPEDFVIIKLPLKETIVIKDKIRLISDTFFSLMIDNDEITLVIPDGEWKKISDGFLELKIDRTYKVISLDFPLQWTVKGYLSYITRLLVEIGISIGIISCYSKNYLLIKKHDIFMAIQVLTNFFNECRRLIGE
jgi:hypothetical protein